MSESTALSNLAVDLFKVILVYITRRILSRADFHRRWKGRGKCSGNWRAGVRVMSAERRIVGAGGWLVGANAGSRGGFWMRAKVFGFERGNYNTFFNKNILTKLMQYAIMVATLLIGWCFINFKVGRRSYYGWN